MAVTPNYGWPVPVATDYVKNGYEAIADLGDAIDATVFALPAGGLTLISATTMTASASASVNNCFTSTYDNYRIIFQPTSNTASTTLQLRLRLAGTDTTTDYRGQRLFGFQSGAGSSANVSGTDDMYVGNLVSSQSGGGVTAFDIFSPALAVKTVAVGNAGLVENANDHLTVNFYAIQNTATAFDGFTILAASGTITGTFYLYGYAKA